VKSAVAEYKGESMKIALIFIALALTGVAAFAGLAQSAARAPARSDAATIAVTAGKPAELRFTLSKKTVRRGTVTFKVKNGGQLQHDFKIAGKKTRVLSAGQSATLKVALKKARKYPYLCTIPGHAQAGMKGTLTVK
jgi:uncharacterized cupredoxin-like copper-binding protein